MRALSYLLFLAVFFPLVVKASPIVKAAKKQIGVTVKYDPAYVSLAFPGGDVPQDRGVCTDVVVRALRVAYGVDLQKELNADMKKNFSKYPKNWGLKGPDKNIDHRRVPNLQTFFQRRGYSLGRDLPLSSLKPGDIVTCTLPRNLAHIMIVSDKKNKQGVPLIIHNIGSGTLEEDRLEEFPITGLYRFKAGE